MFSHIVIFWTDPANAEAVDIILAGVEKYIRPIPLVKMLHCGRMATSERKDVVDQSYSVGVNLVFESKADQDAYQVHPLHLDFVANCSASWTRVVVYDFE